MKTKKKLAVAAVYIFCDFLFISAFESYYGKNCSASEACYLQIGDNLIDCNLTETKIFPQFMLLGNISVDEITNLRRVHFENNDNNSSWIDISGEYNFSAITYPAIFLITLNSIRDPGTGKYYFLTFTDKMLMPKGKQIFNIGCIPSENEAIAIDYCISTIYLTVLHLSSNVTMSSLDLLLKKQTLIPTCGKKRIHLEYLEEDKHLKVTIVCFQSSSGYSVFLWKATDKSNCTEKLIWQDKPTTPNIVVPWNDEDGLYCIQLSMKNGFTKEEKFFRLQDLKHNKCLGESELKPWIPKITLNQVRSSLEVDISPTNVCGIQMDLILYQFTENPPSDCNTNHKHRERKFHNQLVHFQEKFSVRFDNLTNGNYCVIVYPKHDACPNSHCKGFSSLTKSLDLLQNTVAEISPVLKDQSFSLMKEILIGLASLSGLLAAVAVLYLTYIKYSNTRKRRICNAWENHLIDVKAELQEIRNISPRKRILLLYACENNEMDDLISHFINVLEKCFFCKIIHCFNDYEMNEIIKKSPSGWILHNIRHADKIILIESHHTYKMQQHWIASESFDINSNEDSIFLSGLITIQNKQYQYNYSQIAVVRFNFTPSNVKLEDVVEACRYILPSSLSDLFLNIHRENLATENDMEGNADRMRADELLEFWERKCPIYDTFLQACYRMKSSFSDSLLPSSSTLKQTDLMEHEDSVV